MKILQSNELDIGADILKSEKVIAFPTETVFGLGVIFDSEKAYRALVEVKRRPPEKPFTLMLADPKDVEKYMVLNDISRRLVNAFMPGQFTIIGKAKEDLPKWCISSDGNIGIRIADYDLVRNLIRKTGKPLLVPSANKSGEPPANSVDEVNDALGNEIEACFEGTTTSKTPSTIVLVEESYKMIREGVITLEQINSVLEGK